MNAEIHHLETTPRAGQLAAPQLRTLVVCDIADSTALVERMGDQNAANIIRKHDRLARALIEQHRGREIDKTDGFLLLFDRPIQAVAFALDYQRGLKHLSAAEGVVLRARVGVHMGDVVIWENSPEDVSRGAKPIEVEGLVKPVAARLAQLALPQQILVSSAAAGIARRAQGELGREAAAHVHWKTHGPYRFKGLPESLDVFEVGEEKIAPLHAPRSVRTAKRILPWYRRPLTLAAEAAMLAIGIGIGAWFLLQSPPTLAFGQRDWVVVGDLHNLTGDSRFDQSVDTALHISLEQSQYVNVLPELSVQQTLQRMQRNPDKTPINRAIGAEVALRDGARALILPTLAEVGGRVRVTAEVVDPNTQTTVYSVSADGTGAQSVLPSIDKVSAQLRGKLGEALAMVSKNSQPLDKVATSNLDALRAYSLGQRIYDSGDVSASLPLYQQALKVDPNFALAHLALARALFDDNHNDAAADQLKLANPDRLTARDALYLKAWEATLNSPKTSVQAWKTLAEIYPDFYPAVGAYAYFLWQYSNDYDAATKAAERSIDSRNPHRVASQYLLGVLYLGNEHYADSIKSFDELKEAGRKRGGFYAEAYAAERKFKVASPLIPQSNDDATGINAVLAVDQGELTQALAFLKKASARPTLEALKKSRLNAIAICIRTIIEKGTNTDEALTEFAKAENAALLASSGIDHSQSHFNLLLTAYLMAHVGDFKQAGALLEKVSAYDPQDTYPANEQMLRITKAEILRASGHPDQAIESLKSTIDGTELYLTHVALMDAYRDAKEYHSALSEARWLQTHRGRAYTEYNSEWVLSAFDVAQSDLALLDAAEFSVALKDQKSAQYYLSSFRGAWSQSDNSALIASRVKKVEAAL